MNRTDNMADFPHTTLDSDKLIWWFEHFATTKKYRNVLGNGTLRIHCSKRAAAASLVFTPSPTNI
jgi:hypothetical protein